MRSAITNRHDSHDADHSPHPESGMTLVEVMIASAILLIGSLGIIGIILNNYAAVGQSQSVTTAYQLSQTTIGILRSSGNNALSFDGFNTASGPTAGNTLVAADESDITALVAALSSGVETVAVTSSLGNGSCPCTATISINWNDQNGQPENYSAQTVVGY
jgi:type IV pilus assembly protein PilV